MIAIFTQATHHLAKTIHVRQIPVLVKQFSDGELYVKITEEISDPHILLIASTPAPTNNLLELFFLLDTLRRAGAKTITLFFTYFGYARQAIAQQGEACSAELICSMLSQFFPEKIYIIDAHNSSALQRYMSYINLIDTDFFCSKAQPYDAIASPDKGSYALAKKIAQKTDKDLIELHKLRPEHEQVKLELVNGSVQGKKILLIDDMISTGRTIIEASMLLHKAGACQVSAAATHGIFTQGAYEQIEQSSLAKIYITNSLNNSSRGKIEVYDISGFIQTTIQTMFV